MRGHDRERHDSVPRSHRASQNQLLLAGPASMDPYPQPPPRRLGTHHLRITGPHPHRAGPSNDHLAEAEPLRKLRSGVTGHGVGGALSAELLSAAAHMQAEAREQRMRMDNWRRKFKELETEAREAKDAHAELSLSYRSIVAQLEEVSTQSETQDRRLSALLLQMDAYQAKIGALEQAVGRAGKFKNEVLVQLRDLETDNTDQELQIEALVAEITSLKVAARSAAAKTAAADARVGSLTHKLQTASAAADRADARAKAAADDIAALRASLAETKLQLGHARSENELLREKNKLQLAQLAAERERAELREREHARAASLLHVSPTRTQHLATAALVPPRPRHKRKHKHKHKHRHNRKGKPVATRVSPSYAAPCDSSSGSASAPASAHDSGHDSASNPPLKPAPEPKPEPEPQLATRPHRDPSIRASLSLSLSPSPPLSSKSSQPPQQPSRANDIPVWQRRAQEQRQNRAPPNPAVVTARTYSRRGRRKRMGSSPVAKLHACSPSALKRQRNLAAGKRDVSLFDEPQTEANADPFAFRSGSDP
ncbi:uncharacterized protein AMSG_07521 [Thecamonas trahens ATCC 50062]|uniref:Uncharacterized protein n=1 Tax=Thecamonas trahens ATCC 50062 TaxID=461836 RepID=A0A0L0DHD8_THETB|nr:hypothetical protein AMSG_07521 [Thecamonas trahens ATCC 50062]KNC51610.1 hypothetical protein AMSG_07521 [Thecamonas trahens ATCC 50062]|eukprot:XP_013756006.1 hypothetical protein AMSG_07521 [Thecamonas trahens ATCC 50062]